MLVYTVVIQKPLSQTLSISFHFLNILGSFKCANESLEKQDCKCTGHVIYGKGRSWTAPMYVRNEIECTNAIFGDPIPYTAKECLCLKSG